MGRELFDVKYFPLIVIFKKNWATLDLALVSPLTGTDPRRHIRYLSVYAQPTYE